MGMIKAAENMEDRHQGGYICLSIQWRKDPLGLLGNPNSTVPTRGTTEDAVRIGIRVPSRGKHSVTIQATCYCFRGICLRFFRDL